MKIPILEQDRRSPRRIGLVGKISAQFYLSALAEAGIFLKVAEVWTEDIAIVYFVFTLSRA